MFDNVRKREELREMNSIRNRRNVASAPGDALPLLLDERTASKAMGVSLSFLRRARSEGLVGKRTEAPKFVRLGKRVYYRRTDVDRWIENLSTQQAI
jgi:predicted DNA-binding transcriptional regulator AlpA